MRARACGRKTDVLTHARARSLEMPFDSVRAKRTRTQSILIISIISSGDCES